MSERRKHQCHRDGCDSEASFATKIRVLCRAPGVTPIPLTFDCSIRVCAKHALESDVRKYLLNDKNRETMLTKIVDQGYPEPDLLSLSVTFEPIKAERAPLKIDTARTHCCDRANCSNVAKWQVKRLFRMMWQRGRGKPMIEVLTNMLVCDDCRARVRPQDFPEGETRAWLNAKGVSMPDLKTAEVKFEPLVDGKRLQPKLWVGDDGPVHQFAPKHEPEVARPRESDGA
jgi:hypothetical protein